MPSGGIFLDGTLYAFFWTNHCVQPGTLTPNPAAPLQYPAPTATCAQVPLNNSVGASVLAAASPSDPVLFHHCGYRELWNIADRGCVRMPSGFVYVTASQPPRPIRPEILRPAESVPVFGVPRYRASIPYLAMAPRATFADPNTWSFFAGRNGSGNPIWINRVQWESGHNMAGQWIPPAGAEIYDAMPVGQRCVGEHSVTWNAALGTWLLLYNCSAGQVEARIAPDPWGPWSKPITLIAPGDPGVPCKLVQSAAGCTGLVNYWTLPGSTNPWPGFFYAPFVMDRYTENVPQSTPLLRRATIYWLVSTWNPYQVSVMRSTIEIRD